MKTEVRPAPQLLLLLALLGMLATVLGGWSWETAFYY
jgi:hypothetical protein